MKNIFIINNNVCLNIIYIDNKNIFGSFIFVIDISDHFLENIFNLLIFRETNEILLEHTDIWMRQIKWTKHTPNLARHCLSRKILMSHGYDEEVDYNTISLLKKDSISTCGTYPHAIKSFWMSFASLLIQFTHAVLIIHFESKIRIHPLSAK